MTQQVLRLDAQIQNYQDATREAINSTEDLNHFKEQMDTICAGSPMDSVMMGAWGIQADFEIGGGRRC